MSVYVQLQTVFEYGLLFAMSKRHSKDLSETTPSPKKKKRSEVSTIGVLVDTRPLFSTGFHCPVYTHKPGHFRVKYFTKRAKMAG